MGRIILFLVFLCLVVAVCYGLWLGMQYMLKRSRQRSLARHAPELLRYEDLDPRVASVIIEQKRQLELGMNIVSQILNDPVLLIPSEYATPLEQWLETNQKELQ